jgi:hypothetical protein
MLLSRDSCGTDPKNLYFSQQSRDLINCAKINKKDTKASLHKAKNELLVMKKTNWCSIDRNNFLTKIRKKDSLIYKTTPSSRSKS